MSFRIANKQAKKSPHHQHRLGAVIVKGGRVLSTGYNSIRYTKELKEPSLHAEGAAILKLLKEGRLHDLAGAELFVSRFTKGGSIGMARPCSNCHSLLASVGIKHVHYTTDLGTTMSYKV